MPQERKFNGQDRGLGPSPESFCFEEAIQSCPFGMVVVDENSRIAYCNRAATKRHGMRPGLRIDRFLDPDAVLRQDADAILRCPAGISQRVRIDAVDIDWSGSRCQLLTVCRHESNSNDIARFHLTRGLHFAAVGSLAAALPEQLGGSVTAALLAAETALNLLDKPNSQQLVRTCLNTIVSVMAHSGDQIQETLQASRAAFGRSSPCNVNRLIVQACGLVRADAERTSGRINLELDSALPLTVVNNRILELAIISLMMQTAECHLPAKVIEISTFLDSDSQIGIRFIHEHLRCEQPPVQKDRQLDWFFDQPAGVGQQGCHAGMGFDAGQRLIETVDGTVEGNDHSGKRTVITARIPYCSPEKQGRTIRS